MTSFVVAEYLHDQDVQCLLSNCVNQDHLEEFSENRGLMVVGVKILRWNTIPKEFSLFKSTEVGCCGTS